MDAAGAARLRLSETCVPRSNCLKILADIASLRLDSCAQDCSIAAMYIAIFEPVVLAASLNEHLQPPQDRFFAYNAKCS